MSGTAHRQDRDRRHRADRVRQGPGRLRAVARVPGDLGWRSTTPVSRRATSTGWRCSRWRRDARSTSPATSASATSRSSPRSATAAAPAAASSGTRRWPSPPASAEVAVAWRARKRAAKTSRPWAQVSRRITGHWQWSRPWGVLRPVDEIAMLTRRYMHEFGATRDHLANVAVASRKHANRNPAATMYDKPLTREQYMEGRWISEPLCLYDNCLETDGALGSRDHVGRAGARPPAPAGLRALVRPGHPAAAPDDDQLLQRRPAARAGVGVRRRRCGAAPTSAPPTSRSRSSTTPSAR